MKRKHLFFPFSLLLMWFEKKANNYYGWNVILAMNCWYSSVHCYHLLNYSDCSSNRICCMLFLPTKRFLWQKCVSNMEKKHQISRSFTKYWFLALFLLFLWFQAIKLWWKHEKQLLQWCFNNNNEFGMTKRTNSLYAKLNFEWDHQLNIKTHQLILISIKSIKKWGSICKQIFFSLRNIKSNIYWF